MIYNLRYIFDIAKLLNLSLIGYQICDLFWVLYLGFYQILLKLWENLDQFWLGLKFDWKPNASTF